MTDRILDIGSAGLESTDEKVRKLMDNMANSEVPGYKKSDVVIGSFPLALEVAENKLAGSKPVVEGTYYNNLKGALVKTGGNLDLALGSDGYFVVSGQWGEGYTRDGRFHLDRDGRLLSVAGNFPVTGQLGEIIVSPGSVVAFTQDGDITVDGEIVDRIRVVRVENPNTLETLNGSVFKKVNEATVILEEENPRVIQGYVEASNVNIIDQMMEMIYLERTYNINTKIIQTRDETLSRAIELGRSAQ